MSSIELKGLMETQSYLRDELPEHLFEGAKEAFRHVTFAAHREVSGNLSGSPLKSRTGLLRKSLKTELAGMDLKSLRAGIYTAKNVGSTQVLYAPIHEFGGTVKAKAAYKKVPGGPYLNIPTSANKTPAGVMRMSAKQVFTSGGYIAKTKAGIFGVFLNGQMMFSLHEKVEIKARLGMRDAVEGQIPNLLSQLRELALE